MLNLPNILTLARLAALPFIIALLMLETPWGMASYIAFALYLFAALTDFLDGKLARKYNQVTPFGTFLDPVADKIFVVALLMTFAGLGRLPGLWLIPAIIIIIREFTISGLREFLGPHNIQMPVSKLAKWKTAAQMIAVGVLIVGPVLPLGILMGQWILTIAAILSVMTATDYLNVGFTQIKKLSRR